MPNERISMSKLKQLIGLQSSNLSVRALSRALGLSVGAVSKYLRALRACRIDAGEADKLSEVELERKVFGIAPAKSTTRGDLKKGAITYAKGLRPRLGPVIIQLTSSCPLSGRPI
jgi:transcriptional regulator with XRE-family HTH domain